MTCIETRNLLDAWIDGEAPEPPHVESCVACRREAEARRALKGRFRSLSLPAPAALATRLRAVMSPRRWNFVPATAAAAVLVALLFLVRPSPTEPLPEIVARAAAFHDRVVRGQVRPDRADHPASLARYFRERLNLDVVIPPPGQETTLAGGCCCDLPGQESAAPYILYRVRDIPLSLLVVEDHHPSFPSQAKRIRQEQAYFVFRIGRCTVLCCCAGPVCHVWIAEMDETALLEAILATSIGRQAFSGERIPLSGVT